MDVVQSKPNQLNNFIKLQPELMFTQLVVHAAASWL